MEETTLQEILRKLIVLMEYGDVNTASPTVFTQRYQESKREVIELIKSLGRS